MPSATQRQDYDLDIQEATPTGDQLKSILQYVGPGKVGTVVQGARDITDAMEKVKRDGGLFNRPLVSIDVPSGWGENANGVFLR